MFVYEKKLQYPVKIARPNPKLAAVIISQYGGPDGELGASLRYLSQRYSMPYAELKGLLTDIGTEELGHLEMIGAIVHQLTRDLSDEQIKTAGFDTYFVDHTAGVYPTAASGFPWSAATIGVKGDVIADLTEDLAADGATAQEQHLRDCRDRSLVISNGQARAHMLVQKGVLSVEQRQTHCRSVFKDGKREPDPAEYTRLWAALINQLERSKAVLAGAQSQD